MKKSLNKYYFVAYEFKNNNFDDWSKANTVIDIHPLIWLMSMKYNNIQTVILFWEEINKDYYDIVKDEL